MMVLAFSLQGLLKQNLLKVHLYYSVLGSVVFCSFSGIYRAAFVFLNFTS